MSLSPDPDHTNKDGFGFFGDYVNAHPSVRENLHQEDRAPRLYYIGDRSMSIADAEQTVQDMQRAIGWLRRQGVSA